MKVFFIHLLLLLIGCNTINDPYARVCVSKKVKNMKIKAFNLISGINETRFIVERCLCSCKCELIGSVCN